MPKEDNLKKGDPVKPFSKDYQPSGEAKSKGKLKANFLKNIAAQIVTGEFADGLIKTAKELGIEIVELDVETAMHLKQMELAMKLGDTKAYNAVLDRLNGKPHQVTEITGKDGERISPTVINFTKRD